MKGPCAETFGLPSAGSSVQVPTQLDIWGWPWSVHIWEQTWQSVGPSWLRTADCDLGRRQNQEEGSYSHPGLNPWVGLFALEKVSESPGGKPLPQSV